MALALPWTSLPLLLLLSYDAGAQQTRPNIIMIVTDDMGWGDVGQHNPSMHTPNIQAMKEKGMFLNQSYVMPTCAPSRSAFLTGRYPHRYMMQTNQIEGAVLAWLNETLKLAPAYFKELGYDTFAFGKWHLGNCNWSFTPTYRGFDHFRGFHGGAQDFFLHRGEGEYSYDFWKDREVDFEPVGTYATELYTTFAEDVFRTHDRSKPFYMYLAHQAIHGPHQVPEHYITEYCSHVTNRSRAVKCGMAAALDLSVRNITRTLDEEGLSNNTILVFLSDNGGPVLESGVNWPYRGSKASVWEGGVKSVTWVRAPGLLSQTGVTYPYMIHAIDWLPTLYEAAGGNPADLVDVDGMSQWQSLRDFNPGTRTEFILNMNDDLKYLGIRSGKYKLLRGTPGKKNGWYPPPELLVSGEAQWEDVDKAWLTKQWHLYDLEQDPYERNDIYEQSQKLNQVKAMRDKLLYAEANELMPFVERAKNTDKGKLDKFWGYDRPGWCNAYNLPSFLPTDEYYPDTNIRVTRPAILP